MFPTELMNIESIKHCELVPCTITKDQYVHFKVTTPPKDKQTQERKDDPFLPRTG